MADFGLTRRKVIAGAAAALMAATTIGAGTSVAFAGPKEDAAAAIKWLNADTARLQRQGKAADVRAAAAEAKIKAADKAIAASENGLTCLNNLNATIVREGGVPALSPARRAELRKVRDHCDALAAGGA